MLYYSWLLANPIVAQPLVFLYPYTHIVVKVHIPLSTDYRLGIQYITLTFNVFFHLHAFLYSANILSQHLLLHYPSLNVPILHSFLPLWLCLDNLFLFLLHKFFLIVISFLLWPEKAWTIWVEKLAERHQKVNFLARESSISELCKYFHDTVSELKQLAYFIDYSDNHINNAISMTYNSSILRYSPDLRQMLRGVSSQLPATLAGDTFNVCPILYATMF